MIAKDRDALICDLAETYQIYDYKQVPVSTLATLAVGLRDTSRIKLKMAGMNYSLETLLLAAAVDRLSLLLWSRTKNAERGKNAPQQILSLLTSGSRKPKGFSSPADFWNTRERIIKGGES
ncbi:DUF5361 domain-containing protein [Mobilibacterium timonense]|uniref:DUF5361 domain-containing protein n=1 Tax=Mobilibacterium timonense TaxID=1871012 RepID=UPI000986795C|nr:DUF5361 domain-containing protein [Mobilibacterium timonense]